jgi:hypothetical protein
MDRAFALGWPHVRVVGDEPLFAGLPEAPRVRFSRDEALAAVRPALEAARVAAGAPGAAEALAFGRHLIAFGRPRGLGEAEFFLLEGLIGAEVLAVAMVSALEEISKVEWRKAQELMAFYWLGLVLLRVDAAAAGALRVRLEEVYARRAEEGGPLTVATDLVLHGAAGARRSAPRRMATTNPSDGEEIRASHALLVNDDPALLTAIARAPNFDRACGARLAFLGNRSTLEAVVERWYASGSASEQAYFLGTVGEIAGDAMVAPTREAVRSSKVKKAAATWLERQEQTPEPPAPLPGPVDPATLRSCRGDSFEFGFVLIAAEGAEQLRGNEDDHTTLTANADPTTDNLAPAEAHGTRAVCFCPDGVVLGVTPEGALVWHWGPPDDTVALAAFAAAPARDWLPVTTMELPTGRLLGLSASATLEESRASGELIEVQLAPGRYDVREARADDDADPALPPLVWLRRI